MWVFRFSGESPKVDIRKIPSRPPVGSGLWLRIVGGQRGWFWLRLWFWEPSAQPQEKIQKAESEELENAGECDRGLKTRTPVPEVPSRHSPPGRTQLQFNSAQRATQRWQPLILS